MIRYSRFRIILTLNSFNSYDLSVSNRKRTDELSPHCRLEFAICVKVQTMFNVEGRRAFDL